MGRIHQCLAPLIVAGRTICQCDRQAGHKGEHMWTRPGWVGTVYWVDRDEAEQERLEAMRAAWAARQTGPDA